MTPNWHALSEAQRAPFFEWMAETENFGSRMERMNDELGGRGMAWVQTAYALGAAYRRVAENPDAFLAEIAAMPLSREEPLPDYDDAARALDDLIRRARAMQEKKA
tara:strand:+ start:45378 stop:45695 length:318 start_codon:yes stop_codon:yes gene_type:complete